MGYGHFKRIFLTNRTRSREDDSTKRDSRGKKEKKKKKGDMKIFIGRGKLGFTIERKDINSLVFDKYARNRIAHAFSFTLKGRNIYIRSRSFLLFILDKVLNYKTIYKSDLIRSEYIIKGNIVDNNLLRSL